jgi:hypothetical protein
MVRGQERRREEQEWEREREGYEEDANEEIHRTVGPSVIRNALNELVDLRNEQQSRSNGTSPVRGHTP